MSLWIQVRCIPDSGLPWVCVPRADATSLIDFLLQERVRVTYGNYPSHLSVCFLTLTCEAAQALLNRWLAGRHSRRGGTHHAHKHTHPPLTG